MCASNVNVNFLMFKICIQPYGKRPRIAKEK